MALNAKGEVLIDAHHQTSMSAVFAAGDVTDTPYKQIVIAAAEGACYICEETMFYMAEIEALSDKITLKHYDIEKDAEIAKQYNVEVVPSTVLLNAKEAYEGVKFYGIPLRCLLR